MNDAAEIVRHYQWRGFRHFELKRRLIRHARVIRALDPATAEELLERARRVR